MIDRIDIRICANALANALFAASKQGHVTRIDIDGIRAACVGYLAANDMTIGPKNVEAFIDATLRKVVEKVG